MDYPLGDSYTQNARLQSVLDCTKHGIVSIDLIKRLHSVYEGHVRKEYNNSNHNFLSHAVYMRDFYRAVLDRYGG